jgi:hypothetical protein
MDKLPPSPGNVMPPAPSPASRQPAPAPPTPAKRTRRRRMLVTASTVAVLLGAVVLVRYQTAPFDDAEEPLDRLERAADVAADPEPVPAAPAIETIPVASAGIGGAPVEQRPADPVVIVPPRRKPVMATPAKKHVAASAKTTVKPEAKTIAKSTARPAWPIAPPAGSTPAKADTAATRVQALSASTEGPAPVTLTGCLEMTVNRDEFSLSDTDGAYAPRSRSWRTGFLTKRPTPVALVNAPDPYGLQREVGKRVAATGQLVDREMKVSSVRVVGSSCE